MPSWVSPVETDIAAGGQQWTPAVNNGVEHFPSKFPGPCPPTSQGRPPVVLTADGDGDRWHRTGLLCQLHAPGRGRRSGFLLRLRTRSPPIRLGCVPVDRFTDHRSGCFETRVEAGRPCGWCRPEDGSGGLRLGSRCRAAIGMISLVVAVTDKLVRQRWKFKIRDVERVPMSCPNSY